MIALLNSRVSERVGGLRGIASRFLGQAVDIAKVVFQSAPILIRLFPDTSGRFAKPAAFTEALSQSWRQILAPLTRANPVARCCIRTSTRLKTRRRTENSLTVHRHSPSIELRARKRWCTMRDEFASKGFLAVTVAGLVLLCSGFVAFAFT